MSSDRVIVVGAGVVGSAVALAIARSGRTVEVLDDGAARPPASHAAAGMLSPLTEARQHPDLLALARHSLSLFPSLADRLPETVPPVGFARCGKLEVAPDAARARALQASVPAWQQASPGVRWLDTEALRTAHPGLGPLQGAVWFPEDARVDPRGLVAALRAALQGAGAVVHERTRVEALVRDGPRTVGVRCSDGAIRTADLVVLAAGAWTGRIGALPHAVPPDPVRGEMLALAAGPGDPGCILHSPEVYVVPRPDRVLIGGTMGREGFDTDPRDPPLRRLRSEAERLVPALAGRREVERWAGLRPGTPDDLPVLGEDPDHPGLLYATGHFRNGVLLAPGTADVVLALVEGRRPAVPVAAFAPTRLT